MPCFLAGSEIIRCEPYSWCVRTNRLSDVCSFCIKQKKRLQFCEKCSVAVYCSDKCQENDYVNHRLECSLLRSATERLDTTTRFCIRTLTLKKREISLGRITRGEKFRKTLADLVAPLWEGDQEDKVRNAKKIFALIQNRMKVTLREVLVCLLQLHVHSIAVEDYKGAPLGRGLYLDQTEFDHSCEAESRVGAHFDGKIFVLRALQNFRVCSLAKIRMSFVPRSLPVMRRQELLAQEFYIQCECASCLAELQVCRRENAIERCLRDLLSADIEMERKFSLTLEILPKCEGRVHSYYLSKVYGNLASFSNSLGRYEDGIEFAAKALQYEGDLRLVTGLFEELLYAMNELEWNDFRKSNFGLFLDTLQSHKRLLESRLGKDHKETERVSRVYFFYLTRSYVSSKMTSLHEMLREKLSFVSARLLLVARVAMNGEGGVASKRTNSR
ncbi:N-lysine methyltransferase SMYD2-A-like [Galendromus occidentalis]|uniref:N-lysine methyltransferase SMYD2-A-like n=1 Tax=Galendromus occidentalis TaxID=34638 RepID=A0AAJ6VY94_9ACAR|nr:N-lysine methyltransferase SMYD2-A-like [Galendromus occidentalis]